MTCTAAITCMIYTFLHDLYALYDIYDVYDLYHLYDLNDLYDFRYAYGLYVWRDISGGAGRCRTLRGFRGRRRSTRN